MGGGDKEKGVLKGRLMLLAREAMLLRSACVAGARTLIFRVQSRSIEERLRVAAGLLVEMTAHDRGEQGASPRKRIERCVDLCFLEDFTDETPHPVKLERRMVCDIELLGDEQNLYFCVRTN